MTCDGQATLRINPVFLPCKSQVKSISTPESSPASMPMKSRRVVSPYISAVPSE